MLHEFGELPETEGGAHGSNDEPKDGHNFLKLRRLLLTLLLIIRLCAVRKHSM